MSKSPNSPGEGEQQQSGESTEKKSVAYDPHEGETRLYDGWVSQGLFHADVNSSKPPYTIVIPPPNVTAILHLGHALNNTIQDILIRTRRMQGYEAEWLPGTDHAGIATQVLVEKQLRKEGIDRRTIGREKFLERTTEWADKNKFAILNQLRKIGSSADWDRTRYTLDPQLSRAVFVVFKHLFEKGLIYKGKRIVNWCPTDRTTLSDDEVEHQDQNSFLWQIRYKLKGADEYLTVATTRPETLLGDTALAVNPKDPRYKKYIGQSVLLPIMDREIPVIGDTYIDMNFGTGVLKVTPAHDTNDFEIARRHDLPELNILNPDGTLNENTGKFKGLKVAEAREQVLEELRNRKLLAKEEPYVLPARICYRCGSKIEPYLSEQWFVKMGPLSEPAIQAVKSGTLRFHPEYWTKTYLHWMENIRDWCISRQLWWGHRIPVWYATDGTMFVSQERPLASECVKNGKQYDPATLTQDEDVLDTWFSSWLWPFSTFGWPDETPEMKKFYPTNTLVTASEIIFLWVARMVMAGYEFVGKCPFNDVYIHGTVRDERGLKMSKSLGNGIDPLEIIEKYGTDALRMSLVLVSPDGQDPNVGRNTFELGRNFSNKLYQASRFVMMRSEGIAIPAFASLKSSDLMLFDRWILSRLARTIEQTSRTTDEFRLFATAKTLYSFVWDDYCSWYLELIKPDQQGESIRAQSLSVANYVLEEILRLLHPFVPFVTEEIFQQLRDDRTASVVRGPWANLRTADIDLDLENRLKLIQDLVVAVRSLRSELNVPPSKKSDLHIRAGSPETAKLLEEYSSYFRSLAKVEKLECGIDVKRPALSASAVISGAELFVPLAGLIDVDQERARLNKQLSELKDALEKLSRKLANADFLAKAAADVIDKEKGKKADYEERIEKLNKNLEQLVGW